MLFSSEATPPRPYAAYRAQTVVSTNNNSSSTSTSSSSSATSITCSCCGCSCCGSSCSTCSTCSSSYSDTCSCSCGGSRSSSATTPTTSATSPSSSSTSSSSAAARARRNTRGAWVCEACYAAEIRMKSQYSPPSSSSASARRRYPIDGGLNAASALAAASFTPAKVLLPEGTSASAALAATPLLHIARPGLGGAMPVSPAAPPPVVVAAAQAQQPQQPKPGSAPPMEFVQTTTDGQPQPQPQPQQEQPQPQPQPQQEQQPQQPQPQQQPAAQGHEAEEQQHPSRPDEPQQHEQQQEQQHSLSGEFMAQYLGHGGQHEHEREHRHHHVKKIFLKDADTQTRRDEFAKPSSGHDEASPARGSAAVGEHEPQQQKKTGGKNFFCQMPEQDPGLATSWTQTLQHRGTSSLAVQPDESELEPLRRKSALQADADAQVDAVSPYVSALHATHLSRCLVDEADERRSLEQLFADVAFASVRAASDLLRNARFAGDAHGARAHTLRAQVDSATLQMAQADEAIQRQQLESHAMQQQLSFSSQAVAAFYSEKAALSVSDLHANVADKDGTIARLKKQLEAQQVAAAATEHTLRDKLRQALLYSQQASCGGGAGAAGPPPPAISVVDLNLPVEVRFARAHAIARKSLELERGVPFQQRQQDDVAVGDDGKNDDNNNDVAMI